MQLILKHRFIIVVFITVFIPAVIGHAQRTDVLSDKKSTQIRPSSGIDEGMFVEINGIQQWITVRGRDLSNPVLLLLHGGPGLAMSSQAPLFSEWEKYFTVVQWDQPGGGATYAKNKDADIGDLTLDRYVRDGLAVAQFIRSHMNVEKIVVMGVSWGTQLGLVMVKQNPDLFSAYVGTGQIVSGKRGGKLGYELALKAARERKDSQAVEALEQVGPPPYKRFEDYIVRQQYTNPPGLPPSPEEQAATADAARILKAPQEPDEHYIAKNLPEFDVIQVFLTTQRSVFKETAKFEARSLGPKYDIPMFVFQGENDINTPTLLAQEFIEEIQAPQKKFAIIPGAGHLTPAFHDELLYLFVTYVLPSAIAAND